MRIWPIYKLGTLCDVKGGKRLPIGAGFSEHGYPYIRARDIRNGRVTFDEPTYIDDRLRSKLKRYRVKKGDICITIVGVNIGDVGFVPAVLDDANLTENAAKLTDFKGVFPPFLNYYLQTRNVRELMQLFASGAAQGKLGLYKIQELPVPVPPLLIQQKIAALLSAYDDLIENNKRRIALLEKMAQEIYCEWFVRMRFPGHEKVKFEKGVPEGWKYKKLDALCSLIKRGISPIYDNEAERLVINQRCIRNGSIDLSEAKRHKTRIPKGKIVQYGDALINSTGVGTLGRVSIVEFVPTDLTVDSHVTICRADPNKICLYYLCHTVKRLQEYFEYIATGSTGQVELSRELIGGTKVIVPDYKIQERFSVIISNIWTKRQTLVTAVTVLGKMRDLLLPRLISGKLSVENCGIQFPPSMQDETETAEKEAICA